MAIGSFSRDATSVPMSEINTTPLVDVMLVLLVIMIITAPLLAQGVRVDLPRVGAAPVDNRPDVVRVAIDASGALSWNGHRLDAGEARARLAAAAACSPQPEIHLSAYRSVAYEHVARLLGDARRAGLARLRFLTLPGDEP